MEISKEELATLIETAVSKAMKSHICVFSSEEKQILKDVATGGKAFKRVIIYLLVGFLLLGVGLKFTPDVLKTFKG